MASWRGSRRRCVRRPSRNAGARALTSVAVGRVSRPDFERVMDERPAMCDAMWRAYSQNALANAMRCDRAMSGISALARREAVTRATLTHLSPGEQRRCTHRAFVVVGEVRDAHDNVLGAGEWIERGLQVSATTEARVMELQE